MDLTLTEGQKMIRDSARQLLEEHCPLSHVRAMQQELPGFSPELWQEMAQVGWMGLALPEEYGGVGGSPLELCLLVEEHGRFLLPGPFVPTAVLGGQSIARFGTEKQKADLLPAIASGDRILTCCGVGPGGSWGSTAPEIVATPSEDGFVLDGSAELVPYAHVADELIVAARRRGEGATGLTMLLAAARADGISFEPVTTVALEPRYRVSLHGVPVPGSCVLGAVDGGTEVAQAIDEWGAAASCAAMVGGAQRVLDMTIAYAADRHQFGRPIGSFQAVQHHCADMATAVISSRYMAYEAIWRLSEGLTASQEVSMAKAWVSDAYQQVCALGHQVHGAVGFTREHDLHLFTRHCYTLALDYGDGTHHRERVAKQLGL
ncbi:MAG: acyl-CoA dehydrogenase family protein [Dehalococcoidia bacterium]